MGVNMKLKEEKQRIVREKFNQFVKKEIDSNGLLRTIETREIIESVLKCAALYKYQKTLILVEILSKVNEGEL